MPLNVIRVMTERLRQTGSCAANRTSKNRWGVILAGGDGSRLLPLTRLLMGDDRPKQFCPIGGDETLLERTSRRISLSIAAANTTIVLTETHEQFYRSALNHMAPENLVVQPVNKGTAPAILYSLLRIDKVAPNATAAFFPSDHYFSDDETFMSHVEAAFDAVAARPDLVILLGITPDAPEEQYGWIEPGPSVHTNASGHFYRVRRFWEKPSRPLAQELMEKGCLWNSFVMIGQVSALLAMIKQAMPDLYRRFAPAKELNLVAERKLAWQLYGSIPSLNFSRAVLANRPENLALFPVSGVEWSDLGEPARVISTFASRRRSSLGCWSLCRKSQRTGRPFVRCSQAS
jgi:mannose-1-phosphate guanylyltransferase